MFNISNLNLFQKNPIPLGYATVRGFGHEVSFKRNEKNNSITQPPLKPNGVNLGFVAQSQDLNIYMSDFLFLF